MGLFNILKRIVGKDKSAPKALEEQSASNVNVSETADSETQLDPIYLEPLSNGLLPGEVLLIDWMDGKDTNSNIPDYFSDRYGLDPETSVAKLREEAFMTEAGLVESLQSFKVPELKDILRQNELKVSGKKQELIDRLMDYLDEAVIHNYIQQKPFKRTSKGQQALDDYDYIVSAHKNESKDGIYNMGEAIKYVSQLDYQPSNSEISWALFQNALVTHYQNQDFRSYRNVYHHMAQQLQREEDFENALLYYLEIFIIDLSGLENGDGLESPERVQIVPGIINNIENLYAKLDLDKESIQDLFGQAWENVSSSLPFHSLDQEACFQRLLATL
ncbi:hypothetical protein GCM10028778_22120 [Barrientosiimonas marina]|uniref:SAP domain-containing protein n=1 Tax=Lentibacillus kimchii TaxID=1542911 RepID=A0ABW2UVH5_9BACI